MGLSWGGSSAPNGVAGAVVLCRFRWVRGPGWPLPHGMWLVLAVDPWIGPLSALSCRSCPCGLDFFQPGGLITRVGITSMQKQKLPGTWRPGLRNPGWPSLLHFVGQRASCLEREIDLGRVMNNLQTLFFSFCTWLNMTNLSLRPQSSCKQFSSVFITNWMEPLHLPCVFPCGFWVFPCGSVGKESACNAGDLGLIPGLGKIPWRRERLPTAVFWPGEFHGRYSSWGCRDLDTTERRSLTALHFCVCSLCVSIKCSQVQMLPRDTRWLLAVHSLVGWDAQVLCCWGFCLRGQGRGDYIMRSVGGVGSGSWEHWWDLKELADPTHSVDVREFFPFHVPQKLCLICLLISWVMLSFFLLLPCTALPPNPVSFRVHGQEASPLSPPVI